MGASRGEDRRAIAHADALTINICTRVQLWVHYSPLASIVGRECCCKICYGLEELPRLRARYGYSCSGAHTALWALWARKAPQRCDTDTKTAHLHMPLQHFTHQLGRGGLGKQNSVLPTERVRWKLSLLQL